MNLVYDQVFGAKTPTYSTVLQLDRKLCGFTVPASLQIAGFGNSESRVGSLYECIPQILQCSLSTIQADLDRFQRQKVADLRAMAISMARSHRDWCQKVRDGGCGRNDC